MADGFQQMLDRYHSSDGERHKADIRRIPDKEQRFQDNKRRFQDIDRIPVNERQTAKHWQNFNGELNISQIIKPLSRVKGPRKEKFPELNL